MVHFVMPGYSGAGGRFPAIFAMPVLPIVEAIGRDGRGEPGSELDSPSSRVLHEISGLDMQQPCPEIQTYGCVQRIRLRLGSSADPAPTLPGSQGSYLLCELHLVVAVGFYVFSGTLRALCVPDLESRSESECIAALMKHSPVRPYPENRRFLRSRTAHRPMRSQRPPDGPAPTGSRPSRRRESRQPAPARLAPD